MRVCHWTRARERGQLGAFTWDARTSRIDIGIDRTTFNGTRDNDNTAETRCLLRAMANPTAQKRRGSSGLQTRT